MWNADNAPMFEKICADLHAPDRGIATAPTAEDPTGNRINAVRTCHDTWKGLHEQSVSEKLATDEAELPPSRTSIT
jgi:hypothetical protein